MANVGYDHTPFLPDSEWRVHDGQRLQPIVIIPGAANADTPSDAIVLFDGTDLSNWQKVSGGDLGWKSKTAHGGHLFR